MKTLGFVTYCEIQKKFIRLLDFGCYRYSIIIFTAIQMINMRRSTLANRQFQQPEYKQNYFFKPDKCYENRSQIMQYIDQKWVKQHLASVRSWGLCPVCRGWPTAADELPWLSETSGKALGTIRASKTLWHAGLFSKYTALVQHPSQNYKFRLQV